MSVCCPAVLLSAEWIVSCTRVTCIQPLSRCSLKFLASSFFSESVVVLFFSLFLFFSTMCSFLFYLWFIGHFVPTSVFPFFSPCLPCPFVFCLFSFSSFFFFFCIYYEFILAEDLCVHLPLLLISLSFSGGFLVKKVFPLFKF